MLTAAVTDPRIAQDHAAQAAAALRAAEHLRGIATNHRPGSGPRAVRASDAAAMDFPAGPTAARPTPPERQTPPHPPRLKPRCPPRETAAKSPEKRLQAPPQHAAKA